MENKSHIYYEQSMTRDEDMVSFEKILKIKWIKGFNRREK
jgi:hypothetical protein